MGLSARAQHKVLTWCHIIEFILIHGALGVSIYRMFNKSITSTRNDTFIMGVSAKSLIIMAYVVLTENVKALWKRASAKANMILGFLEVLFWFAVPIMLVMNISSCQSGLGCALSWTNTVIGFSIAFITLPVAYISFTQWRVYKATGIIPGAKRFAAREKELSSTSSGCDSQSGIYVQMDDQQAQRWGK